MSKATKYKNSPVTPKDQQSLDKYFSSPDLAKKRKKPSMDSPNKESPPNKKHEAEAESTEEAKPANVLDKEAYQHIDTKLNEMEKRLESALSASLSKSISKSVTAGLQTIIDSSLKAALDTMSKNVDKAIEQHPTVKQHGEHLDSLETENMILKTKVRTMEGKQKQMDKKISEMERKLLQNNLIFKGIPETEWEKESVSKQKVFQELTKLTTGDTDQAKLKTAKKMSIRVCKRLGRYNKERPRPLSVEFVSKEDIDFILANKSNLRNDVYVDREYPVEIEKKRKTLRPILTAAKKQKKFRKKCKMVNDLIVIKGKKYGLDRAQGVKDISKLPRSLNPAKISSKSNDDVYGYFGELNPLSNFHRAPFTYENFTYHCSEQLIQRKKAELFKDKLSIKRIENAKTGLECKLLGNKISNFKKSVWETRAKELCGPGIKQKFLENRNALITLVKTTGNRTIVKCTKDTIWGCGMALQDDNCLIKTEWTNQGIMGEILESIREDMAQMLEGIPDEQASDTSSQSSSSEDSSDEREINTTEGAPHEDMVT